MFGKLERHVADDVPRHTRLTLHNTPPDRCCLVQAKKSLHARTFDERPAISGCGYGGEAVLSVQVHEAKDLKNRMSMARNTCIAMRVGETSMQTKVVPDSLTPRWDETFHFDAYDTDTLRVMVLDNTPKGDSLQQQAELGHIEVTLSSLIAAGGSSHNTWFQLEEGSGCMSMEWNGEKGLSRTRQPTEPTVVVESVAAEAKRFIDKRLDAIDYNAMSPSAQVDSRQNEDKAKYTSIGVVEASMKQSGPGGKTDMGGEDQIRALLSELEDVKRKQVEESVRAMTAETLLEEERSVWKLRLEKQSQEESRVSNEMASMRSQLIEQSNQMRELQQRLGIVPSNTAPKGTVETYFPPTHDFSVPESDQKRIDAHSTPRPSEMWHPEVPTQRPIGSRRSSIPDVPIDQLADIQEKTRETSDQKEMEEALNTALSLAEEYKRRAEAAEKQIKHQKGGQPTQPEQTIPRRSSSQSTPQQAAGPVAKPQGLAQGHFQKKLLGKIASSPDERARATGKRSYPVPAEISTIGLPDFNMIDTNGDGVISRDEFYHWAQSVGATSTGLLDGQQQRALQHQASLMSPTVSRVSNFTSSPWRGAKTPSLDDLEEEEFKLRRQMFELVKGETSSLGLNITSMPSTGQGHGYVG